MLAVVHPFTSPTTLKRSWTHQPPSASQATSRVIREVTGRWRRELAGGRPVLITPMEPKATLNSIIRTIWGVVQQQGTKESTQVKTISLGWCQGRRWIWAGRRKMALIAIWLAAPSNHRCKVFIHQLLKLRPVSMPKWTVALLTLPIRLLITSLACPQVTKLRTSTQASKI